MEFRTSAVENLVRGTGGPAQLYTARNLPIFQNRMFQSSQEARGCVRGDVNLIMDQDTGLIFNHTFQPELMTYDVNYQNEQAVSAVFREHLNDICAIMGRHFRSNSLIEVGCGKGHFLEQMQSRGFRITGLDPSYEGSNPSIMREYFAPGVGLRADGIILRHVLEHIQDPVGFLSRIRDTNGGSGKVYIEVPCFDWICEHRAWFDIFYEHVNYFRLSDFYRMFEVISEAGHVFNGQDVYKRQTLHSVLQRAGGFTDIAFGEGAVFIREELKRREKEQLELLTNRFQSDLTSLSLQALANTSGTANGSANATQGIVVGQQLLEQLRNTKPVGRLVIDIDRVLRGPSGVPGDVVLRDGDKLFIPKKTQEITILGEVQSPTSHIYIQGLSRDDYIARSGGITQKADKKRIYVVRANGDVISGERTGWFRRSQSTDMRPGDTIVVPLDAERIRALPLWTAVTTIIYNIAIAVLALRNL